MRPKLLDLFCGAGGCSVGYHRAGFDVTGVDIVSHATYPYELIVGDAVEILADRSFLSSFGVIHASPPCQAFSAMSACRPGLAEKYPDLVAATRAALQEASVPWVIENVMGSPVRRDIVLCGQMFDLKLYRHRLFETSEFVWQPEHPRHVIPGGRAGHWKPGEIISVSGNCSPIKLAREAMGINWMNRADLAEAIPPAYTEYIGGQILDQLRLAA